MPRILFSILMIFLMLTSCEEVKQTAYSEFVAFGSDGWDPVCTLDFTPYPTDSVITPGEKFDIILTLRYSSRNLTDAIPMEITEEDEEGVMATEQVTIALCDRNGKPRGKRGVALYEISDTIKKDYSLPDGYSISIQSLYPADNTLCLRNLGIILVKSGK
ncbi:MAG: hypothetical protein K2M93_07870 [Muribaculaceae bacterium]|nr:hypothetical protein [Muribaculaceae bacterium]